MKILNRNISLEKTGTDNRFLLASNVILSACLLVTLGALVTRHENTILVPPQLDRSVTVGWNSASGDYIKSFALYVSILAGSITPKNVQFVVDNLSTLVSPRIYTDVRKRLLAQAQSGNFIRNAASTHFSPEHIRHDPETGRVFVIGLITVDGANGAGKSSQMVYDMVIKMVDGKPVVDAITNYEGEPHTDEYNKLHSEEIKAKEKENQLRGLSN